MMSMKVPEQIIAKMATVLVLTIYIESTQKKIKFTNFMTDSKC